MRRLSPVPLLALAFAAALPAAVSAQNIVEAIPGDYMDTYAEFKEFEVQVKNEDGADQPLLYRLYRYGLSGDNMPLLVQVHEYGGDFKRMESITKYEKAALPFVMLAFQWKTSTDNQRNWWYGRINKSTKKLVPFAHNAIVRITQEVIRTNQAKTALNCTVDSNRVYIYGHSVGGTGAVQIGLRHPEVFAAVSVTAGWTLFDDRNRPGGVENNFRNAFTQIIGSTPGVPNDAEYPPEEEVKINVNADQAHLAPGAEMSAGAYTDLARYFGQVRTPAWPSPPIYIGQGANDDVEHQGDNLIPALEAQRRAYSYNRTNEGHEGGGVMVRLDKLRHFRKNQSFLAFTSRDYGVNSITQIGWFNDLRTRGWEPGSIIDEATHYKVKLTGTGTSDVTLHRLQKLPHNPGTTYALKLNGADAGTVKADEHGLVTLSKVKDAALIELTVTGVGVRPALEGAGFRAERIAGGFAFSGLPREARLSILSMDGRAVRDLGPARDGQATWNGRDATGRPVAYGVWVLKVDAPSGPSLQKLFLAPR